MYFSPLNWEGLYYFEATENIGLPWGEYVPWFIPNRSSLS